MKPTQPRPKAAGPAGEIADLRARLAEAEETLEAIRAEAVEALVVSGAQREHFGVTPGIMGDAVMAFDTAGRVTFANPAAAQLTGWTQEEALAKPAGRVLPIINIQTRQPAEDIVARVLRSKRTVALANHTALLARDGREIPIEDSAAPILDASGQVAGVVLVFHDVSQKRRAQEALRQSEERFRALVTASSDTVYHMSPDWSEMRHLRGRGSIPDAETASRDWLHTYIPPEDQAHVMAVINNAIRTKTIFEMEHRVLRADGTVGWTFSRAVPLLNRDGNIVEWFGAASDITTRKRAEARLRRFYETDLFAILYWKIDGGVVDVNDQFLKMTGYTREDVRSGLVNWAKITPPEFQEMDEDARRQVRETGVHLPYEKQFIRKDGTRVWGLFSAAAYEDDPTQGVSLILDITAIKKAHEAQSKMRKRDAFLVALSDALRPLANVNEIKATAARILGRHLHANRVAYAEITPEGDVNVEQGYAEGVPGIPGRYRLEDYGPALLREVRAGRNIVANDVLSSPDYTEQQKARYRAVQVVANLNVPLLKHGRAVALLAVHQAAPRQWTDEEVLLAQETVDRTWATVERARAEAALARSHEDLERLVAERTAKLREMVAELEHFSYTITHDMRAPLRAMQGFAELFAEACVGCQAQDAQRFLRRISTSASRMDSLIVDALNYNRTVRQELPLEPVDLAVLLRGMLDSYPELQPSKANIEVPPRIPPVMGNEAGLTQCFSQPPGQRHQVRKARPNASNPHLGRNPTKLPPAKPAPLGSPKPAIHRQRQTFNHAGGPRLGRGQRHRDTPVHAPARLRHVLPRAQYLRRHRHRPRPGAKGHGPHGRQGRRRIRRGQRQPLLARFQAGQITPSSLRLRAAPPTYLFFTSARPDDTLAVDE
jgi:PAS domain S-box-containing protein